MLKEYASVFKRLLQLADITLICVAFFVAHHILAARLGLRPLEQYLLYLPFIVFFSMAFFVFYGMYWSFRTENIPTILLIVLETAGLGFMSFGTSLYLLKIPDFSRTFALAIFALAGALTAVEKISLILALRYIRIKGRNFRNILIAGPCERARRVIGLIDSHSEWGLRIAGLLDEDRGKKGARVSGHEIIGNLDDLRDIVHRMVIDEVIFVVPHSWLSRIEPSVDFLQTEGIRAHLAEDFFDLARSRVTHTELHGFPMLTIEASPEKIWQLSVKRGMELLISGLALVALAPFFLIIAVVVKLDSSGPVFFVQERVGMRGRRFRLFKFRTMEQGAEARLKEFLARNEMKGPVFKLADDPRITRAGCFLRKFSLDELPQLWNVFRGDMSLVGPRPALPTEVTRYDSWHRRRLSMKPGITCIWQCSGRNQIVDFDEWARLDLEYIDKWSLWLDAKIFLKTIPTVIFGVGAR